MNQLAYVVESPAMLADGTRAFSVDADGKKHPGTVRLYVGDEERAKHIAGAGPDRTWRSLPMSELPPKARENLERARRA